MNCFSSNTNAAMGGLCRDPQTVALLSLACRFQARALPSSFEATDTVALIKSVGCRDKVDGRNV
jgi:hypothetical protein